MNTINNLPVLLIGAGGHARVLLEILRLNNDEIIGFIDPNFEKNQHWENLICIGDDDSALQYNPDELSLVNGLGSLPNNNRRWKIASYYREANYHFASVIHPSAVISKEVIIASGAQIMAGVIIQTGSTVGQDTIINTGVQIDHDCKIADNVHIAPGATLCGEVVVQDGAHLGPGVIVVNGVEIGRKSIIGAGSVIVKNIKESVKYIENKEPKTLKFEEKL